MSESINANVQSPRLRDSLDKVRPELAELPADRLLPVGIDPFAAASIARAALPQLETLRSQMEKLPGFDIKNLDKIELYALAMLQAQNLVQAASAPPVHLQELVAEATALRVTLLSDATALSNRGLIDGSTLDSLKGPIGYSNVASDVMTLATIIRANWEKVAGKTAITQAELDRAEVLGDQLSLDIGQKATSPAVMAAVSLERQQVFTLLVSAYDEVRRAVSFIRWNEDDVDEIAPSLYSIRKKRSGTEAKAKPEPVPAPSNPGSEPQLGATQPAVSPVPKVAVGLPGADPFVH